MILQIMGRGTSDKINKLTRALLLILWISLLQKHSDHFTLTSKDFIIFVIGVQPLPSLLQRPTVQHRECQRDTKVTSFWIFAVLLPVGLLNKSTDSFVKGIGIFFQVYVFLIYYYWPSLHTLCNLSSGTFDFFYQRLPCFLNICLKHFSKVYYPPFEVGLLTRAKPPAVGLKMIPRKGCLGKS